MHYHYYVKMTGDYYGPYTNQKTAIKKQAAGKKRLGIEQVYIVRVPRGGKPWESPKLRLVA